jgi:hypothetical protein
MGSVGAELLDANEPLAFDDPANGWAFGHLCQAIGLMWQEVADLSEDRGSRPGWAALVDVETAPADALAWLAQIPGVKLTLRATEAAQRDEVRRASGQAVGRPASMIAKAQTTLTGSKTVRLVERSSSAWQITVITRTTETPNPAATLAALMSEKPGADILIHVVSNAPVIDEGTRTIDAAAGTIDTATLANIT